MSTAAVVAATLVNMLARTYQFVDLNLDQDGAQLFAQALDEAACIRLKAALAELLNVDTEVSNGALNLGVAEEDLDCSQIAGRLVDDRRLGSAQRMRAVFLGMQSNADDPLAHEPCVLPRAHMRHLIVPARAASA